MMDKYIVSPIKIVFMYEIWVEYLVNCVIGGLFSECFPQGLVIVALFISIYRQHACTGILRKIQAFSGKVSGYLM